MNLQSARRYEAARLVVNRNQPDPIECHRPLGRRRAEPPCSGEALDAAWVPISTTPARLVVNRRHRHSKSRQERPFRRRKPPDW